MVKNISEYTQEELEDKIEAIKAERERTANALKRYEEELERKKQEASLGVPLKGTLNEMPFEAVSRCFLEWFSSEASADKFSDYFRNFVEALQKLAEGEPIDIKAIAPLLQKGWVAMDKDREWYWYPEKPEQTLEEWIAVKPAVVLPNFNLKPAEDWRNSLMECGI